MNRDLELEATELVVDLVKARTSDLAPAPYEVPVEVYLDEEHARAERTALFREMPILAALSSEIKAPGDFKSVDLAGVPVLIMRNDDGQIGAYLNACRHRGMKLTEGRGSSTRLRCPYHAWTYNNHGELTNVPKGPESFTGMCTADKGLVPLPAVERHGVVWVKLDKNAGPFDIDAFLGDFGPELASWQLDTWNFVSSREHHPKANWKLALEGYIENYHVAALHPETVAQIAKSYYGCSQTILGDHQRLVFANHMLDPLMEQPKSEWKSFETGAISFIYHIFPGTIFALFWDHYEIFQIFPGDVPGTSTTIQNIFTPEPLVEYDEKKNMEERADFIYTVIQTEDYWAIQQSQETLATGANDSLVFGRQEIALHHLHEVARKHVGAGPAPARRNGVEPAVVGAAGR